MANFVFALVLAIIGGFAAFGFFNGSTTSRLDRLEHDLGVLRSDLREVERRLR